MSNCFFDISKDGTALGRITFKLYDDIVPKTARNFRQLCVGGKTGLSGKPLHYKGSEFHRIIPQNAIMGGDFTIGNGTGGESFEGHKFADENFKVKHTKAGLLSMMNAGPNTNDSKFMITVVPAAWLDGKHVVFGEVVKGMELVKKIESYGSQSGKPNGHIVITNCGVL